MYLQEGRTCHKEVLLAQHLPDVFTCAKCTAGTKVERIYSAYKEEKNWKFLREIWERGERVQSLILQEGRESMELGQVSTQNCSDLLTEDRVARDSRMRCWMGLLSSV